MWATSDFAPRSEAVGIPDTPQAADAGPLLSGRVSQVSTMTLDALIPKLGDVPLESAVQGACNMAFTFARHVEAHEIWLRTVVRYESTFSRTMMRQIYDFGEARRSLGLPWNPVIVRCPFDCDELEENLNNEEEAIISARPQPWAEHSLRRVRAFEHVQWLRRVTTDVTHSNKAK